MEVSGQFCASAALPLGKEPSVPIRSKAGWAPEPVWTLWRTPVPLLTCVWEVSEPNIGTDYPGYFLCVVFFISFSQLLG
jgi:hypothetical protein